MNFIYVVLPTMIARYTETKLEIRELTTDKWVDYSDNVDMWHTVEMDGYSIPEAKALEIHEKYKLKYTQ